MLPPRRVSVIQPNLQVQSPYKPAVALRVTGVSSIGKGVVWRSGKGEALINRSVLAPWLTKGSLRVRVVVPSPILWRVNLRIEIPCKDHMIPTDTVPTVPTSRSGQHCKEIPNPKGGRAVAEWQGVKCTLFVVVASP